MKQAIFIIIIIIAGLMLAGYFIFTLNQVERSTEGERANVDEAKPVLLKIGYETAPKQSLHFCLLEMEKWLEAQSGGYIEVELYPYSQLGDAPELVAMTVSGVIQMSFPLTSDLSALPPKDGKEYPLTIPDSWQLWSAMDGFYLYKNEAAAFTAIDGQLGAAMAATLVDLRGEPLLCLGYAYDGPLVIAYADGVIYTPKSLYNNKIAVSGSPAWIAAYEQFSAQPVATFLSQVYPALYRGQLDIYQTSPSHIASIYLDDYSTTLTLTEHAYAFRPVLVNRKWYEALTTEHADLLAAAVTLFLEQQRALAIAEFQTSIRLLQERGMKIIILDNEEKALWRK